MKQLTLFLLLLFFTSFSLFAQITEESRSMINGMQNALVLELPNTNAKMAKKWWIAFMKDYDARTKKVKGSDELLSDNAEIVSLGGSGSVDVYARLDDIGDAITHTVWFDVGEGSYLSSATSSEKYVEAEKFLMRFALFVTKEKITIELNEEEKEMKSVENEMIKLKRENDNLHRDIEQAKERIARAEAGIEENLKKQEIQKEVVEAQKEVVDEVKKRLGEM